MAASGIAEGAAGAAFAGTSSSGGLSSSSSAYSLQLDSTAWSYDSTNDVYYQTGKVYVANPAATDYENLSIYPSPRGEHRRLTGQRLAPSGSHPRSA